MPENHSKSAQNWRELLVDIKRRGLEIAPDLAIGDGALDFCLPRLTSLSFRERIPDDIFCWGTTRRLRKIHGRNLG
jgi:hypothetical protein